LNELGILEGIEHDPDITQAGLAARLGVAVGTVNWHLKRLIAKGYVKAKRAERKKLRYFLTPEGIALRARLTVDFIENSMTLYRKTRTKARSLLAVINERGYPGVVIAGDGDIADVCRLTCLEMGIQFYRLGDLKTGASGIPVLVIEGTKIALQEPHGAE
jgi:DNA-binding MarR family transcriptional regulator